MRPNKQYMLAAIDRCRRSFGPDSISVISFDREHQRALRFPAGVPSDWSSSQATWDTAARIARDVMLRGMTPAIVWHDTCTTIDEWDQIISAITSPLPHTLPPPDYGPNGKPTPGCIVRLRLTGRDVPAHIYAVTNEATGACLLTYTDVPPSVLDLPMREAIYVIQRAFHAPFGHEPESGCWDYWPRS